jgi:hypothetical protein
MNRTGTVVAVLLTLGVSWEVWTLVNSVSGDTISETVWAAIHDNPIIVFVTGILNGHWFWQRKPKPCSVCSGSAGILARSEDHAVEEFEEMLGVKKGTNQG